MPSIRKKYARDLRELLHDVMELEQGDGLSLLQAQNEARRLAPGLEERRAPRKVLPGISRKAAKRAKRETVNHQKAAIRRECVLRAKGGCEVTGCLGRAEIWDHWLGGSGRRIPKQTLESTWMLCWLHNELRTRNHPSAQWWNDEFRMHCARHGYLFTPHIEKQPLPRRAPSRGEAKP